MARAERTLPPVPLSTSALERRSELRSDTALVPRLLADPASRVLRLHGDAVAVQEGDDGSRLVLGHPEPGDALRLVVYLGEADGVAHLGVVDDPPTGADPALRTLRQVGAHLGAVDAALFATTLALANWHRTHGFCSRCGSPTTAALAGWLRRCTVDGSEHYPRTDPAVIMSVVDDDDRLLLATGRDFRHGGMSVLAGFVEPGETLAAAVAREVYEEVGIEVDDVTYLGDQPWPFPSSLMVGFTARARATTLRLQDEEIAAARWFSRAELVAAIADGSLHIPGPLSIARRLLEHWYGGPVQAPEVVSLR